MLLSASNRTVSPRGTSLALAALLAVALAAQVRADEVDQILKLKTNNRDHLKHYAAEYVVETVQPNTVKNPKTLKFHYKMHLDRLPATARKHSNNPWLMEAQVLEPLAMSFRVSGDTVYFLDQHDKWIEMQLTPELQQQFSGMSEQSLGADPAVQRQKFNIKLLRHNNPIFGPKTRTLEFIPKGQAKLFARMEEDVDDDGLPLATRLFDDAGTQTVQIKVKQHRKVKNFPVVDLMEADSDTPAGHVHTRTACSNVEVETNE